MNIGRAIEIMNAADMVDVSYQGEKIIIQNVNEKTKKATIYTKTNPDYELDVDVYQLIEEM
ncbi:MULTISPECIES: H-type small acid-soluble spore protein [Niallia]|jgi:small acid-soluble spore protein H (minor)|uniref:Small, acid-soluble spore protein H n=1 Tax=Niallia circulans TaxID=1397 RepID=A0A268FHS4_NIACI|nr:H-type small acid-soluble spore protein [Niallia circulans]AYV66430.1 H-type small acid-soluble spore protein [Niallia circulans]AYV70752.1 H-type small acid-soluble spore protein [Niallia circulans]NRG26749.1 H-type small acid-soluble spore protein [Niallia circulans]PAD84908.1 H-type small acid-soluble spore protein [Niallia circulans]QJX62320.1 H-type small acid-soluble spore protein [Niallia circulans]